MGDGIWRTNGYGVSHCDNEDFSQWGWGACPNHLGVKCAEIIVNEIKENTMAGITCENGSVEFNLGLFEYDFELNADVGRLFRRWFEARTGSDGLGSEFIADAVKIRDVLEQALAITNAALRERVSS